MVNCRTAAPVPLSQPHGIPRWRRVAAWPPLTCRRRPCFEHHHPRSRNLDPRGRDASERQTLGSARLGILTTPAEVQTLQSLDAWENQWFPIANARTEETLWSWYLEWSLVARTAIKQRVLLRQLGFLSDRSTPVEEEEDVEDTEKSGIVVTDNAAPAGQTSAGGGTS